MTLGRVAGGLGSAATLRRRPGTRPRDQRPAPIGADPLQQRRRRDAIFDQAGTQAPVERRRERQLVAGIDLELVGQRGRSVRGGRVAAQELVDGRQLAADPRGLAPRRLGRPLGRVQRDAGLLDAVFGLRPHTRRALDHRGSRLGLGVRRLQLLLELEQLPGELDLGVARQRRERGLELGDSRLGGRIGAVGLVLRVQRREPIAVARQSRVDHADGGADRVGPVGHAVARRLRGEAATRQLLALRAASCERLLGLLAAACDRAELALDRLALLSRLLGRRLRRLHREPLGSQLIAGQLPTRLERLALEAGMQLGGLGLALERPQPRARLALDVERPVEVGLRALELELRSAAALAVLAESCRLLDQQPAIARLGGHDRLDPALRDDRVHLLAKARVRQHLDHVDEPAAGAREPVLALPCPIQPALDRDLGSARGQACRRSRRAPARPRLPWPPGVPVSPRRSRPASIDPGSRPATARRAPTAPRR